MADESPREQLRVALQDLDSNALHTLMVAAYDRWCWESASEMDKDWYEVADEILKERGVMSSSSGIQLFPQNGGGVGAPMLTLNQMPQNVTIKANKLVTQAPNNTVDHDVFDLSNGNFELGFDLKNAIMMLILQEMNSGTFTWNGRGLRQEVENAVSGGVSMAEWAIKPMFDRFMEEYEKQKAEAEESA